MGAVCIIGVGTRGGAPGCSVVCSGRSVCASSVWDLPMQVSVRSSVGAEYPGSREAVCGWGGVCIKMI